MAAFHFARLAGFDRPLTGGLDDTGLVQGLLFEQDQRKKQTGVDTVSDQIRERFGSSALRRAASLPHQKMPRPDAGGETPAS